MDKPLVQEYPSPTQVVPADPTRPGSAATPLTSNPPQGATARPASFERESGRLQPTPEMLVGSLGRSSRRGRRVHRRTRDLSRRGLTNVGRRGAAGGAGSGARLAKRTVQLASLFVY